MRIGERIRVHMPGTGYHGCSGLIEDIRQSPEDYPEGEVVYEVSLKGLATVYLRGHQMRLPEAFVP